MPRLRTDADLAEETAIVERLSEFLGELKTLSGPVGWEFDGRNLRFTVTLEVDAVTEPGMVLFGRASLRLPDRHVTSGLTWIDPTGRGGNFDRLDWRPTDIHNNKGFGPLEHRFVLLKDTHHHRLADNAELPIGLLQAIRDGLPVAQPVVPDPPHWAELLALAANRWRVAGLLNIPEPPWQYDLVLPPGKARVKKGQVS